MEWLEGIRTSIRLIEDHVQDPEFEISSVAKAVGISDIYLQKGFKLMTGYSMSEYLRNRRLYMASLDVIANEDKVIDIAYRYGYDTPESFTKAFSRFHGASPIQLRKDHSKTTVFLPLKIKISIQGGLDMDYTVEKMKGFKVVGFERKFSFEDAYANIPKFWDEFWAKYMGPLMAREGKTENEVEETICNCCVGEFGVCIDDQNDGTFRYLIAGVYTEGEAPEGMTTYEFPDMDWAKFMCKGPMPGALQSVNTKLFQEWLPGNPDYEIAMGVNLEWYGKGDPQSADYESGIWVPVRRK